MRRPGGQGGATTVEFALVVPIFIGVVGIGAFFGWLFYTQAQVDRAAQRAARFAAVPTTSGTYDYCHAAVLAQVSADMVSAQVTSAEVEVRDRVAALSTSAPCSGARPQGYVRVTIAHSFSNPFTAVVSMLTPLSGTFTVRGSGQARVEST